MRIYFFAFLISLVLGVLVTPLFQFLAKRLKIEDVPSPPLKKHVRVTPLLGGGAIFCAVAITLLFFIQEQQTAQTFFVSTRLFIGIMLGAAVLLVGGILDDKYNLPPRHQIIWPVCAVLIVILSGLRQDNITNPFFFLRLSEDTLIHLKVASVAVWGFEFVFFTDVFTFMWLMLLIYATKFLDGLNGLVPGISVISATVLFIASLGLGQGAAALLSCIVAGAYLGFLPYNFSGKIFLGEAGSTLSGFFLGVIALMGPAKITITFLILGIPILDALFVVYDRLILSKKSPFQGDLRHVHFKLIERGLSTKQSVILLWMLTAFLGALSLFVQGFGKTFVLMALVLCMIVLLAITRSKKRQSVV